MAHEIDMSNNRANMAYVGEVPWHGLGHELQEGASIEQWQVAAGMDWELKGYPAMYYVPEVNAFQAVAGRQVLTRGDTNTALSIVSDSYKLVQPKAVLEFYRDIVDAAGFKLNTAGVLKGGRKYWALAEIGQEAVIAEKDEMKGYLLLATSCDGSLATTAMFTSIRVVCNNTLGFAVDENNASAKKNIKVSHNSVFDADLAKVQLGVAANSWDAFIQRSKALAGRKVSEKETQDFLIRLFGNEEKEMLEQEKNVARNMKVVQDLFNGKAAGSNLASADGTAWGLLNAVTEFADHHQRSRSSDNRLDSAWFGAGALLKNEAWDAVLDLIAA